jgi:hypothetical protein
VLRGNECGDAAEHGDEHRVGSAPSSLRAPPNVGEAREFVVETAVELRGDEVRHGGP